VGRGGVTELPAVVSPEASAVERAPASVVEGAETLERIGILGGTFDPPHVGHLWLGCLAADAMNLQRILFMPASQPPHKRQRAITAATDRLMMTRLAIGSDPLFELSTIEMERPGPSYTIDSVRQLQAIYGASAELFLVMAADSLREIGAWREPRALLGMIEWIVGPRPGVALPPHAALDGQFGDATSRIHLLEGPSLDVSASEIRERVAAGRAIRYLVPRPVEELIANRGLYRAQRAP
jgi:nicotinate-nucleotide adenylyltransferase